MLDKPAADEQATETIDEQIASDWKEISARHFGADSEPPKAEVAPKIDKAAAAKAEPSEEPASEKSAPARDESGKFAKKAQEPAEKSRQSENELQADSQEAPARDLNRAPSSWKPAAKAAWETIPPDIRAEVLRRESDFLNGQSQLLPDAQMGRTLRRVIAPYEAMIASEGGTAESAVNELLRTAAALRMGSMETRIGTIRAIAQRYGVPLEAFGAQAAPADQQFRDPRIDQFLEMQRQRDEQALYQQQQMQAAQTQQITGMVNEWMSETGANGAPAHPFVDNVIDEMKALLPLIQQQNPTLAHREVLQRAYDRAVLANPETAIIVQQQQQKELEAKRQAENQQKLQDAKKAASVNVPRRASIPSQVKPGSMEETIRETARQLGLTN